MDAVKPCLFHLTSLLAGWVNQSYCLSVCLSTFLSLFLFHPATPPCLCHTAEFLKATFMQSHACTNYLRICANLILKNANQETLTQRLYIYHNFTMFNSFTSFNVILTHVFAQKLQLEHFDCANKFAFDKVCHSALSKNS